MKRREFLTLAGATLLAACKAAPTDVTTPVPGTPPTVTPVPPTPVPSLLARVDAVRPTLESLFDEPEAIEALGDAVLISGADPVTLFEPALQILEGEDAGWPALEAQIAADFGAVDVLQIEGWTLAAAECALAAMLVYGNATR